MKRETARPALLPGVLRRILAALLFPLLLISQIPLNAQGDIRVKGVVTSTTGDPLQGVSIKIKDKNLGTTTNDNGEFNMSVDPMAVLVITHLGYKKIEIPVANRKEINLQLESTSQNMDEVVVVGYGTVKKSDYTGSISQYKVGTLDTKTTTITDQLMGKLAGVNIVPNTGEPGSGITFNIRGMTSVTGSNQPLIVIDGQPIETAYSATQAGMQLDGGAEIPAADPLASINPNDIASIEILKDASSIAIYGSRGANGVVLITTKSGQAGTDKLIYNGRVDVNRLPKQIDVLNTADYLKFRNEAAKNDGLDSAYKQTDIDNILNSGTNIRWQDIIYRTAISQDHQLSLTGRDAKSVYLITGNYTDQESIMQNAAYKRYGMRVNYQREISKKLSVAAKTYYSIADRAYGQQSNWTGILGSSAVMGALSFNPLRSAYDSTGDVDEEFANNPVLVTSLVQDKTQIRTLIGNLNLDYKLSKNLTYQIKGGINEIYSLRNVYYPTGTFIGNTAPNGSATRADNANYNYLIDNILTFKKNFSRKHSVNIVGGFSYQKWRNKSTSVTNLNFPSNALSYYNFQQASSPGRMITVDRSRALASVIGRANYTYDRRYIFTLTGRYDGASRLANGNKWKLFPSVGLGWNLSNEKFFHGGKVVNMIKLRGSVGLAGNENIAIGATKSTYGINYAVLGSAIVPGYVLDNFENPYLSWENTRQINGGVDFGMLDNKLTFSIDVYHKITSDLLINLALPGSSGYGSYYTNIGEVMNRGLDFEASYQVLRSKNVNWTLNGNFSLYDNEVKNMGNLDIIYGHVFAVGGGQLLSQSITVAKPGFPISSFWGYLTDGVYQTADEVAKGPEAGISQPGFIKWVDRDGDGKITDNDKTVIGNPTPDFTYGLTSSLTYKNFTFDFSIFGSQGNDILNFNRWMVGTLNTNGALNSLQETWDNRWTGPGTSNKYPKATTNTVRLQQRMPDWFVEDGSFLRIQSVSLGYNFKVNKIVNSAKVFVSSTNLYTFTGYSGYDPNINGFGSMGLNNGIDFGTLPTPRTFSAGVQLSF